MNRLFTSTPMMKVLKNYKGCIITSPKGDITVSKHILGFINDKTQYENDCEKDDIVKIKNNIQHAA